MVKAIVVDDEIFTAEYICKLLRDLKVEVMDYYTNPIEVLKKVSLLKPDIIFLDIEMPEMNGLELAKRINADGYKGEIVFITAYKQYAIEAFSVNVLGYLLKPVATEELIKVVERLKR